MQFVSDYMRDDTLRHKLNALTQKTFYFDFENWVKGGYFQGDYIPYSLIDGEKMLSNVSVNRMQFLQNGEKRNYIQLGTVMTDEAYRGQGLARKLMERVIADYRDSCDGIYLFGNLSALDFYRKLGFVESVQYRYRLSVPAFGEKDALRPVYQNDALLARYREFARNATPCGAFAQTNGWALQMFYTANGEDVFYLPARECFLVLSEDEEAICLKQIVSEKKILLRDILPFLPATQKPFYLGFTPDAQDTDIVSCEAYDGADDYRFFYMGDALASIADEKLYFPALSHA